MNSTPNLLEIVKQAVRNEFKSSQKIIAPDFQKKLNLPPGTSGGTNQTLLQAFKELAPELNAQFIKGVRGLPSRLEPLPKNQSSEASDLKIETTRTELLGLIALIEKKD